MKIAVGCFDASSAALGAGASDAGVGGLVSGAWEDLIVPTSRPPDAEILRSGLSLGPHPGNAGLAAFALSPNGTSVIDWARSLMKVSLPELKAELENSGPQPISVLRAAGGGTRSEWWTQLKADLSGLPIEATNHPEPGTLGAALLAGLAAGVYPSLECGEMLIAPSRRYEPDRQRAALYEASLQTYQTMVTRLLLAASGNEA